MYQMCFMLVFELFIPLPLSMNDRVLYVILVYFSLLSIF